MGTALELEMKTYEKNKADLVGRHEGKYVLIRGEEVIAVFDSQKDAFQEGNSKFGRKPFLVKQVLKDEEPFDFEKSVEEGNKRFEKAMKKLADL